MEKKRDKVDNTNFPHCPKLEILNIEITSFSMIVATQLLSRVLPLLRTHGLQPTRRLCPCDFPGKNARVVCHFLLHFPCLF